MLPDGRAEASPVTRALRRYSRRLTETGKELAADGAGTGAEHLIRRRLEQGIDRQLGRAAQASVRSGGQVIQFTVSGGYAAGIA